MKKLKLVKVVVPEIIGYFGNSRETMEPDYRCPECGMGVGDNYVCCPYCGSELAWGKTKKPSQGFLRFMRKL